MEQKKFQLNFGIKDIIVFSFFSLASFILLFFLGVLVGKNFAIINQQIVFPVEKIEQPQTDTPQNTISDKIKSTKIIEKPQKSVAKPAPKKIVKKSEIIQKKPNVNITSVPRETEDLFEKNDYVIQIIAYKDKTKAENLQNLLKKSFYPAYILVFKTNSTTYYRVRIGSYSYKEVQRVKQDLEKEFTNLKNTKILKIK